MTDDELKNFMENAFIEFYNNTNGEIISIEEIPSGEFKGRHVLVIHDDPWPSGSGFKAPILLDEGTQNWLREMLDKLEIIERKI